MCQWVTKMRHYDNTQWYIYARQFLFSLSELEQKLTSSIIKICTPEIKQYLCIMLTEISYIMFSWDKF